MCLLKYCYVPHKHKKDGMYMHSKPSKCKSKDNMQGNWPHDVIILGMILFHICLHWNTYLHLLDNSQLDFLYWLTWVPWIGNNRNLVTHKLILTMRKRTTTCIIGVWFITSTTIEGKLKLSSASSSRNTRTNNRERIDILTVGLLAEIREHGWCRGKNTFSEQSRQCFPKTLYASYLV
jgi:hypothetical protein